jgi:hypothetical protein
VLGLALTWFFGDRGVCQNKWGSQLTKLSREERTSINTGELQLVEWFKGECRWTSSIPESDAEVVSYWCYAVHIDPEQRRDVKAIAEEPSKRLPKGKQGVEVWGDFLQRLSAAAKQAVRKDYNITWLEELEQSNKVRYHPCRLVQK